MSRFIMRIIGRFIPLFVVSCAVAGDFSQFRGSPGTGVTDAEELPLSWNAEDNIAWQIDSPGSGWSQPVVWGNHLFITGAVSEGRLKPANFAGGVKSPQSMGITAFAKPPSDRTEWKVFCLSADDGHLVWEKTVTEGHARYSVHPSNSYATETPVVDQDGIYAYFGSAGIVAGLTRTGSLMRTRDIGVFPASNSFGTGSSLAIHEGKVFVQNFSEESAAVHCFATLTGDEVWKSERDENATSWSTPLIWTNEQRVELILSGNQQVDSRNPNTGELL